MCACACVCVCVISRASLPSLLVSRYVCVYVCMHVCVCENERACIMYVCMYVPKVRFALALTSDGICPVTVAARNSRGLSLWIKHALNSQCAQWSARYHHSIVCLRILRVRFVCIIAGLLERDVCGRHSSRHIAKLLRSVHWVQPCGLPGAGDRSNGHTYTVSIVNIRYHTLRFMMELRTCNSSC
jgi:hypothetical protein